MHVGYAAAFQHVADYPDRLFMRRELDMCLQAEELGLDSIWFTEHHFSEYSMMPDPLQGLAYVAGRTRHVKLGTGVIVLPWHDPVRVAEQVILLDHLSGGRVVMGLGRGLSRHEYEGLRIDQSTSRARFTEYAELLLRALETGVVEGGETLGQPHRELRPRPLRSFKGRALSAAVSPESGPIMARLGLGLLFVNLKSWDAMRADLQRYRDTWHEAHGAGDQPPKPFVSTVVFVDESAERAHELGNQYGAISHDVSVRHYGMSDPDFGRTRGYEFYRDLRVAPGADGGDATDPFRKNFFGSPQQVLDRFAELKEALDVQGVFVIFLGMPHDDGERNLRCFVEHCLPELKSWPAVSSLELGARFA